MPLISYIVSVLRHRPDKHAPKVRFMSILEDTLPQAAAEELLRTAINWGRHSELFSYHQDTETFSFEDPSVDHKEGA